MMRFLNAVFRFLVDAMLYPFRELHPLVGLILLSLGFAVIALLLFKWTSDQEKLEQVKRRIHAGLFEIRLFNDNLGYIFRAMFEILRHNLTYMRLALIPLLWMIVLLGPVFAQLHFNYGYRGLKPGEDTLVKMTLRDDWQGDSRPDVRLETPAGLLLDGGPVWIPSKKELVWRVVAEDWGEYELSFNVEGQEVTKGFQVSDKVRRRSPIRPSTIFGQLYYPAEAPVPDSSTVAEIAMTYPPGDAGTGWESEFAWITVLLVISIVAAFALKKPLGVTI